MVGNQPRHNGVTKSRKKVEKSRRKTGGVGDQCTEKQGRREDGSDNEEFSTSGEVLDASDRKELDEVLQKMARGELKEYTKFIHNLATVAKFLLEEFPSSLSRIRPLLKSSPRLLDFILEGPQTEILPQNKLPLLWTGEEPGNERKQSARILNKGTAQQNDVAPRSIGKTGRVAQKLTSVKTRAARSRVPRRISADTDTRSSSDGDMEQPQSFCAEKSSSPVQTPVSPSISTSHPSLAETATQPPPAVLSGPESANTQAGAEPDQPPLELSSVNPLGNCAAPQSLQGGQLANHTSLSGFPHPVAVPGGYPPSFTWPGTGQIPPQSFGPYYMPTSIPGGQTVGPGWIGTVPPHVPPFITQATLGSTIPNSNIHAPVPALSHLWAHNLAGPQQPQPQAPHQQTNTTVPGPQPQSSHFENLFPNTDIGEFLQ